MASVTSESRRCSTYVIDESSSVLRSSADTTDSSDLRPRRQLHYGDSACSTTDPSRQSCIVYDYYRNEVANFSGTSSARTEAPPQEDDDDFADENESNASELLKEIDLSIGSFDQAAFELASCQKGEPTVKARTRRVAR